MPTPASTELVWTNLPTSWGVFVLVAAVAALLYAIYALYRKEQPDCPGWVKVLLATLRAAAVLLLAAIFLNPSLVELFERKEQPTIAVLRDASQSMNTADPRPGTQDQAPTTRVQRVNELLASAKLQLLERLADKGRLQVLDFADDVKNVAIPAAGPLPPLVATGRGTDLAAAIRQALKATHPAAIVLLSDGQHTGQEPAAQAAKESSAQGVPLLVVGVGDPSRRRNIKVASIYARPQVWEEEPFEIEAVIGFESVDNGEVRVDLLERPASTDPSLRGGSVVQSQTIEPPPGGSGQKAIRFSHTAREPGDHVYEVRLSSAAADEEPDDNEAASNLVKVLSRERLRVLLVAGSPTWDYRLVQRLLSRDKTLTVSCWLQTLDVGRPQEGTRPITQLPRSNEELFSFDVVVLLDPDPREFDATWIDLLQQFVGEHAGGVLYMAGPKFTGRFLTDPRTARLATLLPVTFGDLAAAQAAALLSTSTRPWPLSVVSAASDHAVLRFSADRDTSLRQWESLPGVLWSFPADSARPAAEILLEHSDVTLRGSQGNRPLLVAGRYGAGHVLYMGFTDTWRWRRAAGGGLFDKFWIQTIRYLAEGRSLAGHRRGTLEVDRERYELGEQVTLRARLLDASYQPLDVPRLVASVEVAGEAATETALMPVANQPGMYEALLTARQTGVHRVRAVLPGGDAETVSVEATFRVQLPSAETNQVWLNRPLLQELASLSGGRYFDLDEIDQLPAAIPDRTETVVSRSQPRPLWDTGGMLAVLVGLLCTEWFLRKRYKLL